MKKPGIILNLLVILFLFQSMDAVAQRSYMRGKIRNEIKQNIKEDQEEKQRARGREELKKISYENDTRYPEPENRVQATFEMEMISYNKNGVAEKPIKSMIIFGKNGECMVMNADTKEEIRILFDYDKKANYMVNPKEKTATKMPIINIKKMVERMAERQDLAENENGIWKVTNETKSINGYHCKKHIYTDKDGTKMETWVTKEISIDISENYLLGSRIKDYGTDETAKANENLPSGMMIRNIIYDKKTGKPSSQTDVTSFQKSSNQSYFDLSGYEVIDVLNKL